MAISRETSGNAKQNQIDVSAPAEKIAQTNLPDETCSSPSQPTIPKKRKSGRKRGQRGPRDAAKVQRAKLLELTHSQRIDSALKTITDAVADGDRTSARWLLEQEMLRAKMEAEQQAKKREKDNSFKLVVYIPAKNPR